MTKAKRKEQIALKIQDEKRLFGYRQIMQRYIQSVAQQAADEMGYPILITQVQILREKKVPKRYVWRECVINYTSDCGTNDYYQYWPLIKKIATRFAGHYSLRHVKAADGRFVTTEEYLDITHQLNASKL